MTDTLFSTIKDESTPVEPFFLVGAERSGTTLMGLILDHHPHIYCPYESDYLIEYLDENGGEPSPVVLQNLLSKDRIARLDGFSIREGQSYKEAARSFLREGAEASGKPLSGAIIHSHLPLLLKVWPQAKILHLIRDPRDVAPSVVTMGWAGNPWHGAQPWLRSFKEAAVLLEQVPAKRKMRLTFEDLVTDPQDALTQVCDFLGTSFDPAMLYYPESPNYGPPDASAASRWKTRMAPKDIQLIEACVGESLEAAGYRLSGQPLRKIGKLPKMRLRIQNKLGKLRFRIRRHGLMTVLSYAVNERLRRHAAANRLLRKMQDTDQALLR